MAYTNDTKARQGLRVNGKLVWVEPGETLDTGSDTPKPAAKQDDAPEKREPEPDKYDAMEDAELRDLIEDRDGKRPHHNTKREKLLEMARAD